MGEEVREKRQNAVNYFRDAYAINQKSRSADEVVSLCTEVKRQQSKERAEVPQNSSLQREQARATITETSPGNQSQKMAQSVSNVNVQEVPKQQPERPPKRKKTLLEQFGYGVKPKETEPSIFQVPTPDNDTNKRSSFAKIEAGNNDLFQRLASKR